MYVPSVVTLSADAKSLLMCVYSGSRQANAPKAEFIRKVNGGWILDIKTDLRRYEAMHHTHHRPLSPLSYP